MTGGSRRGRVRAWSPDTRLQDLAPREAAGSHHRGFGAPEGRQEGAHLPEEARRAKEGTWDCADASGAPGSWGCGERKPTGCPPASLSKAPAPAGSAVLLPPQRCDECRAQSRAPTPRELALGARPCVRHPEYRGEGSSMAQLDQSPVRSSRAPGKPIHTPGLDLLIWEEGTATPRLQCSRTSRGLRVPAGGPGPTSR